MSKKYVYLFSEGNAGMRNLLGGKGANLAEMTGLGLPVPQGFTISTEACTKYYEDGRQINPEIQAEIMDGFAETFIGRELDVLVMGREPDGTPWGRSEYDSPDIDSRVIFSGDAKPGDMVRVRIDSVDDGELIGEQI